MSKKDEEELVDDFVKEGVDYAKRRAQQRYKQLRGRRGHEQQMWEKWVSGGKKTKDLEPLLESIDPMISREASKRVAGLGGRIPKTTLQNELRNHAVTALHNYQPNKGSQLSTYIHTNFKRVTDFVAQNRNTKKMPRTKVEKYQEFQNAKEAFKNKMGREPTTMELKAMLPRWSTKVLNEMERGFGQEVFSNMGTPLEGDYSPEDDVRGAYLTVKPLMTAEERRFAEKHYPPAGKRQMSIAAIARAMNIPQHKAYRIKKKVEQKMQRVRKKQ